MSRSTYQLPTFSWWQTIFWSAERKNVEQMRWYNKWMSGWNYAQTGGPEPAPSLYRDGTMLSGFDTLFMDGFRSGKLPPPPPPDRLIDKC